MRSFCPSRSTTRKRTAQSSTSASTMCPSTTLVALTAARDTGTISRQVRRSRELPTGIATTRPLGAVGIVHARQVGVVAEPDAMAFAAASIGQERAPLVARELAEHVCDA